MNTKIKTYLKPIVVFALALICIISCAFGLNGLVVSQAEATPVFFENFESGTLGNFTTEVNEGVNGTDMPATIESGENRINGVSSVIVNYKENGEYWLDCMKANYAFGDQKYTIAFRYKVLSINAEQGFTVKLAHMDSGLYNRGAGFYANGVNTNHLISATATATETSAGSGIYNVVMVVEASGQYTGISISSSGAVSVIIDDFAIYEGEVTPVFSEIELTNPAPVIPTPALSENFENGTLGNFTSEFNSTINATTTPAVVESGVDRINGAYSAKIVYEATGMYWNYCMQAPYGFAGKTYTLAFRYKILDIAQDAFITFKIGHQSNGTLDKGTGFFATEANMSHNFSDNVVVESAGNDVYNAFMVITPTDEYTKIVFSATGAATYIVDDIALYEGNVVPTFSEIELTNPEPEIKCDCCEDCADCICEQGQECNPDCTCGGENCNPASVVPATPIMSENFEGGSLGNFYSNFDGTINTTSVPAYTTYGSDRINGAYSALITYEETGAYWNYCMLSDYAFETKTYTFAFRYKIISANSGTFITLKLTHESNGMLNRGVGFDANGIVEDHKINVISASAKSIGNGIYEAYIVLEAATDFNKITFSATGPVKYVVDDFALYEGNVVPAFSEIKLEEVQTVTPILTENFENGKLGNFYSKYDERINKAFLPAKPIYGENAINGAYSANVIYEETGEYWNYCLMSNAAFEASTYTIAFRYKVLDMANGAFFTLKIGHKENGMLDRGAGFDVNGAVPSHQIDVINVVSLHIGNGVYNAYIVLDGTVDHNKLVFAATGACSFVVDDIALYIGNTTPVFENVEKTNAQITVESTTDFERTTDGAFTTGEEYVGSNYFGSAYTSSMDNKINGYYSKILFSNNEWCNHFTTKIGELEKNTLYTVAFRYKALENYMEYPWKDNSAIICGLKSDGQGSLAKYASFTKDGKTQMFLNMNGNPTFWYNDILAVNITDKDGYYDVEILFETNNEEKYDFNIGFYGGGAMVIDDVRVIKGYGSDTLDAPVKKDMSNYPSVSLSGLRPTDGWVNVVLNLPKANAENANQDGVIVKVQKPNGDVQTLTYSQGMTYTPEQTGEYTFYYVVTNEEGFDVSTYFKTDVSEEPAIPTISLTQEQKDNCVGKVDRLIMLPTPAVTYDKDGELDVLVEGPNGFKAYDDLFIIPAAGEYKVTYTAVNAKGESATLSFTFTVADDGVNQGGGEEEIIPDEPTTDSGCGSTIYSNGSITLVVIVTLVTALVIKRRKEGAK